MRDQYFYGHGKILLTGEYFVMDGALALALPTTVGQSMKVKYRQSYQPTLNWKSLDHTGKVWFESDYEYWHFKPIKNQDSAKQDFVQRVLSAARQLNPHFMRDDVDVFVETKVEFPVEWGLGSSSTFVYNVAQLAYVSPFELMKRTIGGSGYDVACAQAMGPITYQRIDGKPQWESVSFNPSFIENLYFIYLGNPTPAAEREVHDFSQVEGLNSIIADISMLTKELLTTQNLKMFEKILVAHEEIIATHLGKTKVKDTHFSDYWGVVKSLGAWGGNFVLVTTDRSHEETREYFMNKGYSTILPYEELIQKDFFGNRQI